MLSNFLASIGTILVGVAMSSFLPNVPTDFGLLGFMSIGFLFSALIAFDPEQE